MDEKQDKGKRRYRKPVLRVYGRVEQLTQSTGTMNGDAGQSMMVSSDRRRKRNIVRVGDHPLGIGLYLFDYVSEHPELGGHGRQFGVMADEVEAVMPEAVSVRPDGYKMVSYRLLGIHQIPN